MKLKKSLITLISGVIILIAAFIGCESFSLTVEKEKGSDQISATTTVEPGKKGDQSSSVIKKDQNLKKGGVNADKRE